MGRTKSQRVTCSACERTFLSAENLEGHDCRPADDSLIPVVPRAPGLHAQAPSRYQVLADEIAAAHRAGTVTDMESLRSSGLLDGVSEVIATMALDTLRNNGIRLAEPFVPKRARTIETGTVHCGYSKCAAEYADRQALMIHLDESHAVTHGEYQTYSWGCRGDLCMGAMQAYVAWQKEVRKTHAANARDRRRAEAKIGYDGTEPWHGTRAGRTSHYCDCERCDQASKSYTNTYYAKSVSPKRTGSSNDDDLLCLHCVSTNGGHVSQRASAVRAQSERRLVVSSAN